MSIHIGPLEIAGFEELASDPTDYVWRGRFYYNTTLGVARIYDGTVWQSINVSGSTSLDDTDSAFFLNLGSTSTLTANRTLTFDAEDGDRILRLAGDLIKAGSDSLTLTTTGVTNVTLPTSGTLATTSGETHTNPTLNGAVVLNSVDTLKLDDTDSAFDTEVRSTSTNTADRVLTLDVEDGNRTLQLAGNLSKAGADALTLTTTGVTNVTLPTSGTLAITSGETHTTPTLTEGVIDNFTDFENQGSTPASPSAGYLRVYSKSDDTLYKKTSAGVESAIGSGSGGGGGINYIQTNPDGTAGNHNAEGNVTTGWATYADAAATTPVDGTGGSPNVTIAAQASNIIRGNFSFRLAKGAANRQGEGVSYAFSTDAADDSKVLQISFDVDATSANYADNDVGIYIYDVTNSTLITPSVVNIKKAKYTFQASFLASTSNSYRLIFHVASTNATAWDLDFDNVSVGPESVVQGAPVGPSTSISLTFSAGVGTPTSTSYSYTRVGQWMHLTGRLVTGTVTATDVSFDLPAGLTIDTSVFGSTNRIFDNAVFFTANGNNTSWYNDGRFGTLGFDGSDTNTIYFYEGSLTGNLWRKIPGNLAAYFATGVLVNFSCRIPIAEWAGSTVSLDNTRVEYVYNTSSQTAAGASDTSSFGYGPDGAAINAINSNTANNTTTFRCRFLTPVQPTDVVSLEIKDDNNQWISAEDRGWSPTRASTSIYGIFCRPVSGSTTDFNVSFGNKGADQTNATYAGDGSAWSSFTSSRWRVVKCSNPLSIGQTQKLPTEMTNEQSTALGLKTYYHGTSYYNSVAPTVTGTSSFSVTRAFFQVKQDAAGNWFLSGVIRGTNSSSASLTLTINGVTFKNVSSWNQAVAVAPQSAANYAYGYATPNSDDIELASGAAQTGWTVTLPCLELESKPTWAY